MYKCDECEKEFETYNGLRGHLRMHGKSKGKPTVVKIMCCCVLTKKEVQVKFLESYQSRIKPCPHCGKPVQPHKKFCNSSCSASFNNIQRQKDGFVITEEHKQKTRESMYKHINKTNERFRGRPQYVEGAPYSKIHYRVCKNCGTNFIFQSPVKYCSICAEKYGAEYRSRYKFLFNVYHYPDIFDISLIEKVGWYSRGGNAGEWNPDGLSRDHKVSVTEAIKNGYEPYYIKHPLNCEIMPWVDNVRKHAKSSMTYDDLVKVVDEYDAIHRKMYATVKKV